MLNPGQYSRIKKLFLETDSIDPPMNLLRNATLPKVIKVREDLERSSKPMVLRELSIAKWARHW